LADMTGESAGGRPAAEDEKRMKLRYAGSCRLCGVELPARAEAIYERATRTVRCAACESAPVDLERTQSVVEPKVVPRDVGVAGASARREHERRKTRDDERLRARWGRLGGIAVALSDERQTTRVWQQGAIGEERLGARLDSLASDDLVALHDRRIPGTRANIDHLVITGGGVWVIDAKRYVGRRPELRIEGGIIRPRVEKLLVGRRDQTKLVDGVLKQVDLVGGAVGDVAVSGALCFLDADWPLIGGAFTMRGVHVTWPKRMAKLLSDGSGDVDVDAVAALLAERFPPA
jgi:hypothetical protein